MSADGRVLAVGSLGESSTDCRIDGNQHDTSQPNAGAVYVFERTPQDRMEQRAYIKACGRPRRELLRLHHGHGPRGRPAGSGCAL